MKIRPTPFPLRAKSLSLAAILAAQTIFAGYLLATSVSTASNRVESRAGVSPAPSGQAAAGPRPQPIEVATVEPDTRKASAVAATSHVRLPARVSMFPHFSKSPTDTEIFEAHVFPTALVPIGKTNPAENRALAKTLIRYLKRSHPEDQSILLDYLRQHPDSPWKASLLLNLGLVWRETGYFSEALDAWRQAWQLRACLKSKY